MRLCSGRMTSLGVVVTMVPVCTASSHSRSRQLAHSPGKFIGKPSPPLDAVRDLLCTDLLPLVEPAGRDDAAMALEGIAKGGRVVRVSARALIMRLPTAGSLAAHRGHIHDERLVARVGQRSLCHL